MEEVVLLLHSLILVSVISILSAWKYLSKSNKNVPPSPPKLPILGNLHQLSPLLHRDLQRMATKHGPLMLLHLGNLPTLVVSSAAGARQIMKTHDLAFADRPVSTLSTRLLYDNKDISVSPYGDYWRQLKTISLVHLLSNTRVRSFHFIRKQETCLLVKKIRESCGLPVNLSQMITQLNNDVVCRSAFGSKYSEQGGEEGRKFLRLLKEFLELLGTISIGDFVPCLSWINRVNGFDARVDKVAKGLDQFLEQVLAAREKSLNSKGENFVDILLDIYHSNSVGVSFDRQSIKAIILDMFAAGTDTTSTVVEWAMTQLLRNPLILKKLQNEVRGVVKDKDEITENDIEQMQYLKAVIKETLRYHTPIPLLVPRVARQDVKVMGYEVSAGTMVMINAWAIGRDPTSWDQPQKFNPDRFLNSSVDYKGLDFELIPFGSGRRGCPGIAFAISTNEFVLANLVRYFDWKLPDGCDDLDMCERAGVSVRKALDLLAVGTLNKS